MSVLEKILAKKKHEVAKQIAELPLSELEHNLRYAVPVLDFRQALLTTSSQGSPALIAEIKRRSPSKGALIQNFDFEYLAREYIENGASAISILTDEYFFGGSLDYLRQIAQKDHRLPLLRKDFIYHPYQIYQSRVAGADAVLLITAMLPFEDLSALNTLANDLGMDTLIEVHTEAELAKALSIHPKIVGINNRDLHTFQVSLDTTLKLRDYIPPDVCVVAESGILTSADVQVLSDAGINAILVGEALVTAPDLVRKIRELSSIKYPLGD